MWRMPLGLSLGYRSCHFMLMISLGKSRPHAGKSVKVGNHLGPTGLKFQVPTYSRARLEGCVILPTAWRAPSQSNTYPMHAVLPRTHLQTVNTNMSPFLSRFNLSLTPSVYTLCLLDRAWLVPCPLRLPPLFRLSSSSLACLFCLAMWYPPPRYEATKMAFTRCWTDASPILLEYLASKTKSQMNLYAL